MPLRGTWSERVFSQIRHRNALTKIAWEDTGMGLGMTMSTVVSEKNISFIGNVFYKQWLQGTTSWKSQILIPSKKRDQISFAMEKISSPRNGV